MHAHANGSAETRAVRNPFGSMSSISTTAKQELRAPRHRSCHSPEGTSGCGCYVANAIASSVTRRMTKAIVLEIAHSARSDARAALGSMLVAKPK
jgi:hypothetical protein